ncbi:hypothetical protein FT663_00794 [Candidozyma haemuli var. vulneris]|nr:hypothetical protein FT662_00886 [[Candida] haemuloni var. vulneris]KAF3995095.1 hypothetical protein FT663_00794 [[Candida] haemuloni var. vulneris]
MTKEIALQEFDDTFALSYTLEVSGTEKVKFHFVLDVFLNGTKLDETNHCVQRLHAALEKSSFLQQLFFEVSPSKEKHGSITLYLKCKLFADTLGDFKHADNVGYIEKIHFIFKYTTSCPSVYFSSLFNNLQYCFCSAMLDLEKQYPFVFSFYGKHLYEINYSTMLRCFTELATPLQGPGEADQSEMLQLVLEKLNHFMLTKFNTIAVMKECDKSPYRLQQCKKSIARPFEPDDKRLLRNVALVYRVLAEDPE